MAFDKEVWLVHRKLHHRFIKYRNYFVAATDDLSDYQVRDGKNVASAASKSKSGKAGSNAVISLLTESDDSDSDPDLEES